MDRLLDVVGSGPHYLRHPDIAAAVEEAIWYGSEQLNYYSVHAFVIMSNHVHLLISPLVALPKVTKSLKNFTARRANLILGLTGTPFWQEESYDRLVRNSGEFNRIRNYIEENPVRAGLVSERGEYRWSSAWPRQVAP